MKYFILPLFIICLALPSGASAQITFHPTLGEDMVLQQNSRVELYGKAVPGDALTLRCSWDGQRHRVRAGADSTWSVFVQTPAGSYVPQTIRITGRGQSAQLSGVLIGEVWLCSGQSNMEMPLRGFPSQPVEGSLEGIVSSLRYRNLRLYNLAKNVADTPQTSCRGRWMRSEPGTVASFSAIGFMFGSQLSEALDVPVGVIVSCYGGSKVESWMDMASVERYDTTDYVTAARADVRYRAPATLYNGMVCPLLRTAVRGVVWYQGESNRSNAHVYARMLTDMMRCWRRGWGNDTLPFIVCQICPYQSVDKIYGARLMEAQYKAVAATPGSYIVGTSDAGSRTFIHAPEKALVAARVTATALGAVYGHQGIPLAGPAFKSVEFTGGKAVVAFENVPRGLVPAEGPVDCFELAGADGVFHPAAARVVNRVTVEVRSDSVPDPRYVRYAFTSWHKTNLYNTEGLPAYPFRSDENH